MILEAFKSISTALAASWLWVAALLFLFASADPILKSIVRGSFRQALLAVQLACFDAMALLFILTHRVLFPVEWWQKRKQVKPVLAVDFDGTIGVSGSYPKVDRLQPYAAPMLKLLSRHFEIVLWTCRTGASETVARDAVLLHVGFDVLTPKALAYDFPRKISAYAYLDDRTPENLGREEFPWQESAASLLFARFTEKER